MAKNSLGERRANLQCAREKNASGVKEKLRSHCVVISIHDDDILVARVSIKDLLTIIS
jgi:hypothetical protein